ncbi:hypothetical protein ECP02994385_5096, partial [Escherichia coli P0299438.5]
MFISLMPGIARHKRLLRSGRFTRTAATLLFACRFGIAEAARR